LAAGPKEDEGGRGPIVRERRGGGWWPREWGGRLGGLDRLAGQTWRSGRASWAGKEKEKEIHSKLISRFKKMNKEIQVIEIIEKNPKKFQKIVENLGREECELE
jgi:hypothetical protein